MNRSCIILIIALWTVMGYAQVRPPIHQLPQQASSTAQLAVPIGSTRFHAAGMYTIGDTTEPWDAFVALAVDPHGGWRIRGVLDTAGRHLPVTHATLRGTEIVIPELGWTAQLDTNTLASGSATGTWSLSSLTTVDASATLSGVNDEPALVECGTTTVIGINDCPNGPCGLGVRTSQDSGMTFPFAIRTTDGYAFASDPSVVRTPSGMGLAGAVGFNTSGGTLLDNSVFFVTSPDGITWSPPQNVVTTRTIPEATDLPTDPGSKRAAMV